MYNKFFNLMFLYLSRSPYFYFLAPLLITFPPSAASSHPLSNASFPPPAPPSAHLPIYAMFFFFSQLHVDEIEFFMRVCGVVTYLLCMYGLECIRI